MYHFTKSLGWFQAWLDLGAKQEHPAHALPSFDFCLFKRWLTLPGWPLTAPGFHPPAQKTLREDRLYQEHRCFPGLIPFGSVLVVCQSLNQSLGSENWNMMIGPEQSSMSYSPMAV